MNRFTQDKLLPLRIRTADAFSLTDGSYAEGMVLVCGGNQVEVLSSPGKWKYVDIPFTRALTVKTGDVLGFSVSGPDLALNNIQNIGLRINGAYMQQPGDRITADMVYTISVAEDGICDCFFVRDRASSLRETLIVSISLNGEVLL